MVPFCSGPCFRSIKIHAAPAAAMPKECRPALSIPRDKGGAGENALSHLIVLLYRFAQPLSSRKAAGLSDIPRAPLLKKREKRRNLSKKRKEGGRKVFAVHPQDAPVFSKRLAAKSKTRRPRLCGSPPHRQVFPKSRGPSQEKLLPFRPNTQAGCCIQASVGGGFPPYSPGGKRALLKKFSPARPRVLKSILKWCIFKEP